MKQEEHILHYFKKIHDRVEKEGNAILKKEGLTLAQGHILRYLHYSEGYSASMKDVERVMKVAQSTTAGMIARLENHGFVETMTHSGDKRIKIVALTERGLESTSYVKASIDKVQEGLFAKLTEEERETLRGILQKMSSSQD